MYFLKGLLSGITITALNFTLMIIFYIKFSAKMNKILFASIYLIKFIFTAFLIFLFVKFNFGSIIGLFIGITVVLIIFNVGYFIYVRFTGSN
jgi:hypothetical protein